MTNTTSNIEKKGENKMNREGNNAEMVKVFGESFAKAIELECEKKKWTIMEFFNNFINLWADDEFFDYMCELCEKHHIELDWGIDYDEFE